MATASMTSKGQITIPIEVREELGLKTGDRVAFTKAEEGKYFIEPKKGSIMDFAGIFKREGERPLSIEEMNDAVGRHLAEDDDRIKAEYNRYLADQGK